MGRRSASDVTVPRIHGHGAHGIRIPGRHRTHATHWRPGDRTRPALANERHEPYNTANDQEKSIEGHNTKHRGNEFSNQFKGLGNIIRDGEGRGDRNTIESYESDVGPGGATAKFMEID